LLVDRIKSSSTVQHGYGIVAPTFDLRVSCQIGPAAGCRTDVAAASVAASGKFTWHGGFGRASRMAEEKKAKS